MRNTLIFAGSSVPELTQQICTNLGMAPAPVDLSQFANGETSVKIMTSIRQKDVFIVQSGSKRINDSIMELLILISACKGGSSEKVTAVLPYFPYSRQSKKKSHRGAITARMLANLLSVAGVNHVITVDLHASQMQGFFKCPVDNLHAEPLIAKWIRHNVENWQEAVVVSKNPGGTKRVTSLADALKLNFGMVTTDRKRGGNMSSSLIMTKLDKNPHHSDPSPDADIERDPFSLNGVKDTQTDASPQSRPSSSPKVGNPRPRSIHHTPPHIRSNGTGASPVQGSPLARSAQFPVRSAPIEEEDADADTETEVEPQYTDERAKEVTTGRLVQGHVVEDDYPSPTQSAASGSANSGPDEDPMAMSRVSSYFAPEPDVLGGSHDAGASSDEEEEELHNPSLEKMITLVGNVRNRTVFLVDDMIDKAGSWIAAAECVVKRGGAKKVYCIATHGLFGGDSLKELQQCSCIDSIVVTNSFPIPEESVKATRKLVVLDLSYLLSEAIRRNHWGESMSTLFAHASD